MISLNASRVGSSFTGLTVMLTMSVAVENSIARRFITWRPLLPSATYAVFPSADSVTPKADPEVLNPPIKVGAFESLMSTI